MLSEPDSKSRRRGRESALARAASLDDGVDTREAFDAAVKAAVAEAHIGGASLVRQPFPISSPDEITEDLTFGLAFFGIETTRGPKR